MPRRRGQVGELYLQGKGDLQFWVGRFWCDIKQPDGTTKRAKRCFQIGLKSSMSERKARAELFALINQRERAHKFRIVGSSPNEASVDVRCRGSYAEYVAALDLMRRGFEVFRAMSNQAPCDLIASKSGQFYRIEVKFASGIRGRHPKFTAENFDVVALVSSDSSVSYLGNGGEKLPFEQGAVGHIKERDLEKPEVSV